MYGPSLPRLTGTRAAAAAAGDGGGGGDGVV
jgi:hypothetical protein